MFMTQHEADCNCIGCLAKHGPFSRLSQDELEILQKNKYVVKYNPGEVIIKQGATMSHLISLHSGLAKVYREGLNGHKLILQLIKEGEFIMGPGVYTDFKHHYSISAVAKSTACFVDINLFLKIMQNNHDFAKQIHKKENQKKINVLNKMVNLTQKQMTGRIAEALLYLHDTIYETNPFRIQISRSDLADMTALCKESVIRILKQFKEEKMITLKGKKIEILDMERVRYFSEVG